MNKILSLLIGCAALLGCQTPRQNSDRSQASFSFGVLADIQYAEKENRGARHYRTSEERLRECVDELNRHDLAFTIQLGDLIDGNDTPEATLTDLDHILGIHNILTMPSYHVVGNHCLTADREVLRQKLQLDRFYYDFTMPEARGWRFIVLDGNDGGYGLVGEIQLDWLAARLDAARNKGEQVIVFCHFPLLEEASPNHRLQNPQPVLQVINASGGVAAYFAGHDHGGGYAYRNGIHHITIKGIVEAPERNAFAIVEVRPDYLFENGFGQEPDRILEIIRE